MIKKVLIILWFLVTAVMIINIIGNENIPLGFDYGPYKYFIRLYETSDGKIDTLSKTLQYQFEPFSGTFFFYLQTAIPYEFLFTWGYLGAHIFISLIFFIIAKNKGKYSLGSLLGLSLFLVSSIQYGNYAGALGKQLFATIFLLLSIRYNKKIFLNTLFLITCITLHRLTGFIGIIFAFFSLWATRGEKDINKKIIVFGVTIFLSILSYAPSFDFQILPYIIGLTRKIADNVLISGRYGSGFSSSGFWFHEIPLLLMVFLGITNFSKNNYQIIWKNPYIITFLFTASVIIFRGIAHSRFQSFFDLFLLLIFTKYVCTHLSKKWIYIFLIIQSVLWILIFKHDHTPYIDRHEKKIIEEIVNGVPENVHLFSLSSEYRAIMTAYGNRDFRDDYKTFFNIKTKNDKIILSRDKKFLCNRLSKISGEVFLYRGSKEKNPSSLSNTCLHLVKEWKNGSKLLHYSSK